MPAPFLEIQFPPAISYGVRGGPRFNTDIAQVNSGAESRNINWPLPLHKYDAAKGLQTQAQMDEARAFFWCVYGMGYSFRWKDWDDYQVTLASGRINADGLGDGLPSGQLYKLYAFGAQSRTRPIRKPTGTPVLYKNDAPLATPADYTLDATTGEVAWVPSLTQAVDANVVRAVTGLTQANPGVAEIVGHGFGSGDKTRLAAVGGMTQVNGLTVTVTVIDPDHVSIGIDTTGFGAYTSGGTMTKHGIAQTNPVRVYLAGHGFTNGQLAYFAGAGGMTEVNAQAYTVANAAAGYIDLAGVDGTAYGTYTGGASAYLYPQPGDTLKWVGEFDVPVRFDTDAFQGSIEHHNALSWEQIPIVEIRV